MRTLLLPLTILLSLMVHTASAAETRIFTDDAGRQVEVPVRAERVISQNDNRLTLPLLELGVPMVGSAGRLAGDGTPFLRTVPDLLGISLANSDIEFLGTYNDLDYEKIAGLKPDLIFTQRDEFVEPLSRIAPTLYIDPNNYPVKDGMKKLADAAGRLDEYERLLENYENKLATVQNHFPEQQDITVSVSFSFPAGETLYAYTDLGALTVALDDLGLNLPQPILDEGKRSFSVSPEQIQLIDGDFIINFYGNEASAGPEEVRAGLEKFLPNWCAQLHACENDQMIFFPYAAFGYSFSALELNLDLLTTHIAGRQFTPMP